MPTNRRTETPEMATQANNVKFRKMRLDLRIAFAYAFFGGLWILFSDSLLDAFVRDHDQFARLQTYKGWAFVVFGAILLFLLLRRELSALDAAEQKYSTTFNKGAYAAVLAKLPEGVITDVNDEFVNTFGYSRADALGKTSPELGMYPNPEERQRNADAINAQRFVRNAETKLRTKSGVLRDFLVSSDLLEFGGEKYVLTTAKDVTEPKRAEEEIHRRANELAALLEASQSLTMTLELAEVMQKVTEHAANILELETTAIYLLEGEALYLGATTPPLPSKFPDSFRHARLANHPHIREAITTKQPVVLPDATIASLTDAERAISEARGLRSVLYMPLSVGEQVLGTLIVGTVAQPRVFPQSQVDLCRTFANQAAVVIQNARLLGETRQRAEQLASLNTIGRRVASSLSLDEAAQSALEAIIVSILPDLAMFFVREGERLSLCASRSPQNGLRHTETSIHRVGECLCGLAVGEGKPIYSKNIIEDVRCTWRECKEAGVHSFAALPLRAGDEVLGVIGLASKTERDFSQAADFLETLCDQVAAGLKNAHLYKDLQNRLSELTSIYEASQRLQKLLNPEELSYEIIELLEKTLSYEHGAVLLLEESNGQLIPFAVTGFQKDADFIKQDKTFITSHTPRVGQGITGWVAEHGQTVRVGDVRKDERYYNLRDVGIRSEMCVPLFAGEKVIGVLNVETDRPDAYSKDDQRVLETVAAQISVAIQNARLLEAESAARTHAEIIARANAALAQSLDLDTVLDAFLANLRLIVPYDSGNVLFFDGVSSFHTLAQRGYENWTEARPSTMNISQNFSHLAALIKNRASELIPDTEHDPRWMRIAGFEYIRSWLGVPLLAGGEVIGFYSMDHNTPDFFTAEHVHLAETLSAQAAVAIQNARLLEETRLSRDRLAELSKKLVEAHETEARAIGRELHDQVGQMLTALKLTLEIAPQLPAEAAAKKYVQAQELLDDLMSRVSALSLELRPPMLDDLGLVPALLWLVNRFHEQTQIVVDFKHSGVEGRRFISEIETTAYRVTQEALTNVARHAQVGRARLEVRVRGEEMEIQISDNGAGFDVESALAKNRGLGGIRERVQLVGGSFRVQSEVGTRIFIALPLKDAT